MVVSSNLTLGLSFITIFAVMISTNCYSKLNNQFSLERFPFKICLIMLSINNQVSEQYNFLSKVSGIALGNKWWNKVIMKYFLHIFSSSSSSCPQHRFFWLYLAISCYWSSYVISLLDGIQFLHRTNECKFLLIGQNCFVYESKFMGECCLWVCLYFTSHTPCVLFILCWLFVWRWCKWLYSC